MRGVILVIYTLLYHKFSLSEDNRISLNEGVFWNCNVFGDPKKYKFLSELTKEKNLDSIALSEIGRDNIPQSTLNNICAGKDFLWHIKSLKGHSGVMVDGVNLLTYDIGEIEEGEFLVRFKLRNREDDFKWNLV